MDEIEIKKQALADYLGVNVDSIEEGYDENVFEVNDEDGLAVEEYLVLDDWDADEYTKDDIESTMNDMGLLAFTEDFQDWAIVNAVNQDYFETDMYWSIKDDIESMEKDELIEELYQHDLIATREELEDKELDEILDEYEYDLQEAMINYYANSIDWFIDNYGEEELKEHPNAFDLDDIVKECIDWDGRGHFLASYDGVEIDLGEYDGEYLYAYRIG